MPGGDVRRTWGSFLSNISPKAICQTSTNSKAKPTINAVLSFYRKSAESNKEIFPYIAIKAQDKYSKSEVAFIANGKECLPVVTRQQLCLFEFAVNCIKTRDLIHPERFKTNCMSSKK